MTERVLGIVGTGAIGGSIGIRAREDGWRVLGCDIDFAVAQEAVSVRAIAAAASREELYRESDVVVIASHIDAAIDEVRALATQKSKARLVIDVASVKVPIVAAAHGLTQFVATHPMAGTERSGPQAARADLFEGRTWAYVPSQRVELDGAACDFIRSFGALPLAIRAAEHDRLVARTSHLPQLFASLFAASLKDEDDVGRLDDLCGPAARELRRLGQSSPAMWEAIFRYNGANIAREARDFAAALAQASDSLRNGARM